MKRVYLNAANLLTIIVLIFSPLNSSAQQLRLDISLSDTSFSVCQSIWLDVQLTNISADTVRVWGFCFPCGGTFNIVVNNERGDTLKSRLIRDVEMGSGFLLNPKDTCYHCFDLTEFFHNYELRKPAPSINQFARSLAPGRYEVYVEFYFGQEKFTTPKIRFEVIDPTGTEGHVLKVYKEAYDNFLGKNYSLMNQQLNKIITVYPKSIYAERAYWQLFRRDELLEKCPNSGFNMSTLWEFTNKMTKGKKQEYLQKIINAHSGTRSAKFAQQLLRGSK